MFFWTKLTKVLSEKNCIRRKLSPSDKIVYRIKNQTFVYIYFTRGLTGTFRSSPGTIAYRGESKNRHKFLFLPEFQSHHTLRLLLWRINYIQLQRKSNNFHELTIKTKRILGLKLGQIQVHIIMTCALRSAIKL